MKVDEEWLVIGRPCLKDGPPGKVDMVCDVRIPGEGGVRQLRYTVEDRYRDYLTVERSDAFLVGLLPLILQCGGLVRCEAPVSACLLHNLKYRLSNVLRDFKGVSWPRLEIEAAADDSFLGGTHVGTGCSCGIDSCATIAVYSGEDVPRCMRIDTLAFFNVGSHDVPSNGGNARLQEERRRKQDELFSGRMARVRAFADEVGMPLLTVDSNLSEFGAGFSHKATDTLRNVSAVLALGKWFAAYHVASSLKVTLFELTIHNIAMGDVYLLECLSTESTRFHSALSAYDRWERGPLCAGFRPALKYLDVCIDRVGNCLECTKCVRTMFQLELCGILDSFVAVFDVAGFRAHPWLMLRRVMPYRDIHPQLIVQMSNMRKSGEWTLPLPWAVYRVAFALGGFAERLSDLRCGVKRLLGLKKRKRWS